MSEPVRIEVVGKHRAQLPEKKSGEHLWIVLTMFRVAPENEQFHLDGENLLTIDGPGCYWCEQPYTREVAEQPCRG